MIIRAETLIKLILKHEDLSLRSWKNRTNRSGWLAVARGRGIKTQREHLRHREIKYPMKRRSNTFPETKAWK